MPSRAVTSFLRIDQDGRLEVHLVSMPSRAVTSFLPIRCRDGNRGQQALCQCPLGLLPHFYCSYATDNSYSHRTHCVNALSGCYLISTVPLQKPRFYAASRACFCRYLSEYSGNSCFPCMLTIWTHFMRYTYP